MGFLLPFPHDNNLNENWQQQHSSESFFKRQKDEMLLWHFARHYVIRARRKCCSKKDGHDSAASKEAAATVVKTQPAKHSLFTMQVWAEGEVVGTLLTFGKCARKIGTVWLLATAADGPFYGFSPRRFFLDQITPPAITPLTRWNYHRWRR